MKYKLLAFHALRSRLPADDPTAEQIDAVLHRIETELVGLADLISRPDKMKSEMANDLLVNQEKARARDVIARSRGELTTLVTAARSSQEAARLEKAKLVPDAYAGEIRSVFRALDPAGKAKFMGEAIRAGDAPVIAAIVTAPSILSGLPAEQASQYRESYLNSISPNSTAAADELEAICAGALAVANELGRL